MTPPDFDRAMAAVAPFEPRPHVAVALSGGSDSLALCLLAHSWARRRGGRVTALTVDHGLRAESAAEAQRVACWMAARGIDHRVLKWNGEKPRSGVQAAARAARYALMTDWCREEGVLHLVLAHQRDDQAETYVMRLARKSGPDGLACMPPIAYLADVRILRPLLRYSRGDLRAYLTRRGQAWIEDPSNEDAVYARVRARRLVASLAESGPTSEELADTVAALGAARADSDAAVATLLARHAAISPHGVCTVDGAGLATAPEDIGRRALARVVTCIGGGAYAPRSVRLDRLYREVSAGLGKRRTLGGCLVIPDGENILVMREPGSVAGPVAIAAGRELRWDGRFRITVTNPPGRRAGLRRTTVAALGQSDLRELIDKGFSCPSRFRSGLEGAPAIRVGGRVLAVAALGYVAATPTSSEPAAVTVRFEPANRLAGAAFSVV